MLKPSTLFKILFVCILFVTCDDEPLEGEFITNEDVMDDNDGDGNDGDGMDNDNPDDQALLVSQIVEQIQGESETFTTDYTYDSENRLMREDYSDGSALIYNYQNNQLVSTSWGDENNPNIIIETYTYNSEGRIASYTTEINSNSRTSNLIYSSDNTIIEEFDANTNELASRVTLSDGNVITFEEEIDENNTATITETLTYDDMNGPFKNITFRNILIAIASSNIPSSFFLSANNPLTDIATSSDGSESASFTYIYNDEGYPISITEVCDDNGDTETINYTLTYIPAN